METCRVLLVEDDDSLRHTVARGLRRHHFRVTTARDGRSALAHLEGDGADLIVLDIGLPDADGRDVCQALRAKGDNTPVLFMTARGQVADVLSGFSVGGDDYVSKPFELAELVARVTALLRRIEWSPPEDPLAQTHLDPAAHAIVSATGSTVPLSPTEFRILAALMGAPGTAVRRHLLFAAAWPDGAKVSDNALDQYIARLRRKLAAADPERQIKTIHGVGYRYS
ncbi:response regulator transcription factor [Oryzihumus sp.]|jgi:two-component system response regulator MprA|uniref:response regulator transcription factor n=1 Tax=Oryzihumus sp. TaxID=1968903 RepID=UPI002ED86E98